MTLAEFRFIYISPASALHHIAVRKLYWPPWIDLARWMLEADAQQQEGGGYG